MNKQISKIVVCFDMAGCPNRCKHCWIGHSNNKMMLQDDLEYVATEFKKYCDEFAIYSWYKEPDYRDDYKELWKLENELSKGQKPQRFELLSFWRLYRDNSYINWLKEFDIKKYQLTFFGLEEKTDYYTGRTGAFKELIYATNTLLDNGLVPKWQVFANQDNANELNDLLQLSKQMKINERCNELGENFDIFFHQGSCDGESRKLYNKRLTSDGLALISDEFVRLSKRYFETDNIENFLGRQERDIINNLLQDETTLDLLSDETVFYVNNNFDVYPNFSEMSEWFCMGNLKQDGAEKIITNYFNNTSIAQKTATQVPICDMARLYGDTGSQRLFTENDYKMYLLNTYCENL